MTCIKIYSSDCVQQVLKIQDLLSWHQIAQLKSSVPFLRKNNNYLLEKW